MSEELAKEVEEVCKNIIKHGILVQEYTDELLSNYEGEGVEISFMNMAEVAFGNADSLEEKYRIAAFAMSFGARYGSETIEVWGRKRVKAIEDKRGGESDE